MRHKDIQRHLKPYSIVAKRTTTINHAFAACIAPSDTYDEDTIVEALKMLGQDAKHPLLCSYCGDEADTWDHIVATVKNKEFSGYGHRIGNLLPCCKSCNSKKGSKDWRQFVKGLPKKLYVRDDKEKKIESYIAKYSVFDKVPKHLKEYRELQEIRLQILCLFKKADEKASVIREKRLRRIKMLRIIKRSKSDT